MAVAGAPPPPALFLAGRLLAGRGAAFCFIFAPVAVVAFLVAGRPKLPFFTLFFLVAVFFRTSVVEPPSSDD